jgi:hypothetical protein
MEERSEGEWPVLAATVAAMVGIKSRIEVFHEGAIGIVSSILHDQYFSISQLQLETGNERMVLFRQSHGFFRRRFLPECNVLRIKGVQEMVIQDSEQIEFYSLSHLKLDDNMMLRLVSPVPLTLAFCVSHLHLTLEQYDANASRSFPNWEWPT